MTLFRQLLIAISLLILLLFAGTLLVNLHNTRQFLTDQLQSHAQDAATHLGLSLSPHMQQQDKPSMVSMIDAVFDRGYYREIRLTDADGAPFVERNLSVEIQGIPSWFIEYLALQTPRADALVMAGWKPAGKIYVQSHPGYAYRELWHTFTRMLLWFAGAAVMCMVLGGLILKIVFRPLRAVERQAEALCAKQYEIQERLPRTRELRRVVIAMNRMTGKVREMFDEQARSASHLRKLSFQDPVTGLGNRRYLDAQLESHLRAEQESGDGALMIVQLQGLQELNDRQGFAAGDALLKAASDVLVQVTADYGSCVLTRRSGADFAILTRELNSTQLEELGGRLAAGLARLHGQELAPGEHVASAGIAQYRPGQQAVDILSQADMALRSAQSQGPNAWSIHYPPGVSADEQLKGRQDWRAHLESVVRDARVVFYVQTVVDSRNANRVLHNEVLVRIPGTDGELLNAGSFMPMAEQLKIAREIDRAVVTGVLEQIRNGGTGSPYAVNLSPASLRDQGFMGWLHSVLPKSNEPESRIYFEFPEYWALRDLERLRAAARRLREAGHGFGLDHFGRGFGSFGYLQSLRPDYVKIDGAYTGKTSDEDGRFLVRTLCSVAHSLDIAAIAEMVEDREQWQVLAELNIDGVQGYAVNRPHPIDPNG